MEGIGSKGLKTKLIVNYLPQAMTDEEFAQLFSQIGQLDSSKIMRDRGTNYSFGYGFVDYVRPHDAETAIAKLNGFKIGQTNKILRVAFSKPPGANKNVNLYVSGLTPNTTEKMLEELFAPHGELVQARILRNADGSSKSVGFVLFKDKENADAAIRALQGFTNSSGLNLQIKYAKDSKEHQKSHPKYQEFMYQKYVQQNPAAVYSQQNGMNFAQTPTQPIGYQDPYTGGYANQISYGIVGDNMGSKAMRGRDVQSARFNPIARPLANNGIGVVSGVPGTVTAADNSQSVCLYVYNIGPNAVEADLYALFSRFGRITKVNVIKGKGYGFVHMPIPYEATDAINTLNNAPYNGKRLQVSVKTGK